MNKQRIIITLALVTVVALAASAASAQGGRGRHREGGPGWDREGGPDGWRLESLDLSDAQREAIDGIMDQARQDGVELRKEQARLRNRIHGEMLADQPSESTLVELTEKLGALRTELQVLRLKARLKVREQLTEEQRDQLLLMREGPGLHGRHRGLAPRAPGERLRLHRQLFRDQQDADEDRI